MKQDCFRTDGSSTGNYVCSRRTACKRVPVGSGVVIDSDIDLKAFYQSKL